PEPGSRRPARNALAADRGTVDPDPPSGRGRDKRSGGGVAMEGALSCRLHPGGARGRPSSPSLGGGFGSYDFYALDAASGHVLWQYRPEDDGPTAAVVH